MLISISFNFVTLYYFVWNENMPQTSSFNPKMSSLRTPVLKVRRAEVFAPFFLTLILFYPLYFLVMDFYNVHCNLISSI